MIILMVIVSKKEQFKTKHYNLCEYLDFVFVKKQEKFQACLINSS